MSIEFLLFGGRNYEHPQRRPIWHQFQTAVLLRMRDDGEVLQRLEYHGGAIEREVGLSRCFKAGTVIGDQAYACTNTEILTIDLHRFAIVEHHTNRLFNDLHHVNRIADRFFVASTGIDSVLDLDASCELVKRYPIANEEILER